MLGGGGGGGRREGEGDVEQFQQPKPSNQVSSVYYLMSS